MRDWSNRRSHLLFALLFATALSAAGEICPEAPHRFQLGRAVSDSEIAAWDIDVGPDGAGLPEGRGSVSVGERIYGERCATCHGDRGVGGSFDALAGDDRQTIGSHWPYATTIFDYVRRAMPFDRPGSLEDDEVYAVTAYLLYLNGLIARDGVIDAESLAAIRMPALNRFVLDDRRGGAEIR